MLSLRRTVSVLVAVAVAAVCAIALVALLSSGDAHPTASTRAQASGPASDSDLGERRELEVAGRAPTRRDAAMALDAPEGASPVIWVRAGERVEIRTEPGGGERVETVSRRTRFGSPSVFAVFRHVGDWAAISTASQPNGELGWVRLDPDRLRAGWTRTSIVVDLSERRAELYRGARLVSSFTVTIGAAASPTPTGRFAVTDTLRGGLASAYGCCAVALSATQPNLPSGWLGGRRIAIHGTTGALGVATSNGCVRAADEQVSKLIESVDLGTPVRIRA
jgi:lipoprotein-anchoring transpeptidase ErfK/SrfK